MLVFPGLSPFIVDFPDANRPRPLDFVDSVLHCSQCGKGFSQQSTLSRHMKLHVGGRQFACTLCSRIFNRNDNLIRHMRAHCLHDGVRDKVEK